MALRTRFALGAVSIAVFLIASPGAAHAVLKGTTCFASVDTSGQVGKLAWQPAMSDDGRYVLFSSNSVGTFDPADVNHAADVFVRDRVLGTTERVSFGPSGQEPNHDTDAWWTSLSGDGRFVTWSTDAISMTPFSPGFWAMRRDVVNRTTEQVYFVGRDAKRMYLKSVPMLSTDGRYTFRSVEDYDSVEEDANRFVDGVLIDMVEHTAQVVTVADDESPGNGDSLIRSMSTDTRFILFSSEATNMVGDGRAGFFVRDRLLGSTTRIYLWGNGVEASETQLTDLTMSSSGAAIGFMSWEDTIIANPYEGTWNVFVHYPASGQTACVSVTPTGTVSPGGAGNFALNADGSQVAFTSGGGMVLGDDNRRYDVFLRDVPAQTTKRISVTNTRAESVYGGGSNSNPPAINAAGDVIAFESLAYGYGEYHDYNSILVRDLTATATIEQEAEQAEGANRVVVPFASSATIRGQIWTGEGAFGSQWLRVGTASGGALGATKTATDGRYAKTVRPSSKTTYRIAPDASTRWNPGAVRSVTVIPQPYVSTPKAPRRMRPSRAYVVYGSLKPKHVAGSRPVRVYKWRRTSSGRWKPYGYVKAKAYNLDGYTRYKVKMRLGSRGKWRLRAYAPADAGHAAAWSSGYDYVTVK